MSMVCILGGHNYQFRERKFHYDIYVCTKCGKVIER